MNEEEDMLEKWAQRGNFRGENPRGGRGAGGEGQKNPEMMCGEYGLLAKWAQREASRGENPRGGCIGRIGAGKPQRWLVHME